MPGAGGEHFRAPWSPRLKAFTAAFLALMTAMFIATQMPTRLLPLMILGITMAFSVRGYSVRPGMLMVHRVGWSTKLPLDGLVSAEAEPNATIGSIRVFGIGGAFAFVGRFRNSTLGSYRAYVTDPAFCVVLDFGSETVVVTPDSPARFLEALLWAARSRT